MSPSKYRPKRHLLRPPVPHLFHSNRAVTIEEHEAIIKAMARVRVEIDHLKETERVEGDNEAIYRQRLDCEEFVVKHEKLLHWTRRLPLELLIHIFICCTDENTLIPWNISHVCRKWRHVALTTPQLWRKIPIKLAYNDVVTEQRFIQFLNNDYLKRSGDESIIFFWHPTYDQAHQLSAVFLQHAERWGDVQLGINADSDFGPHFSQFFASLQGRLHSLYSLKLTICGAWLEVLLDPFKSAPHLRYLQVEADHFFASDVLFQFDWPWNQVTHFSGSYLWMDICDHTSLARFTNLVYMRICGSIRYAHPVLDGPSVTFNACKYLHIGLNNLALSTSEPDLLKIAHFPAIERLYITFPPLNADGATLADICTFVQRHAGHLQSLHWEFDIPTPLDWRCLMLRDDSSSAHFMNQSLEHLKVLRFTKPLWSSLDRFLTSLVEDRDLLPSLQKLDIGFDFGARTQVIKICELLSALVSGDGEGPESPTKGRRIEEIRLQVPKPEGFLADVPFCMTPWDIVMELEGWTDELQDGWEKQVKLEHELKRVEEWKAVLSGALGDPSGFPMDELETVFIAIEERRVTDVLVLHATRLHEALRTFSDWRYTNPQEQWEARDISERAESLLRRWTPMFVEEGPFRKWATIGADGVVYVSPHSPLRGDSSVWMFGAADNKEDPGYLCKDWIPGINPSWLVHNRELHRFA